MALFFMPFFGGNIGLMLWLGNEDGLVESLGAVCFLVTSVVYLVFYLRYADGIALPFWRTKKSPIVLALSVLFLVFAGEEINWGQRFFHLKTPELLAKVNVQKAINIHNLKFLDGRDAQGHDRRVPLWITSRRLFMLFGGVYLFLVPLLARWKRFSGWASKLNLPIAPLYTGIYFILTYMISRISFLHLRKTYPAELRLPNMANESQETFAAILFLIAALTILQNARKAKGKGRREIDLRRQP
jgi:hypothetical protein